jgi:hypothetical protein
MPTTLPERDWKVFRELREVALDRFCQRALADVEAVIRGQGRTILERYHEVYRLVKDRDKDLAAVFGNPRRSTALFSLAGMRTRELLTDEEFERFSDGTRDTVRTLIDAMSR